MLGHLTLFQQPSHPDNYITDLDLKIKFLSLNVWALELYSHFNLISNECSLTLLQSSAQPSYSFNATDLALCSALSHQVVKVLSSLISALLSKAKLFSLVWRFQFFKALALKTSILETTIFEDFDFHEFSFSRLQFLKTSSFQLFSLQFLKTLNFEDLNFWRLQLLNTSIFEVFNFWRLQFLKTLILKTLILKTSSFKDFNFEDFIS